MLNDNEVMSEIKRDEGLRLKPYYDSVGLLSLGYGRNLQAKPISQAVADLMFIEDYQEAKANVKKALPWITILSPNRQSALIQMSFNLGINGLLGFKNMIRLMQAGDFRLAAEAGLDSKWAQQVPSRAKRIMGLVEKG